MTILKMAHDDTPLADEALAATCQQVGELLEAEGRLIRVAGNVERGKQIQEAARRLRARGTWQPIATAPKDGTPVLACFAPSYGNAAVLHPASAGPVCVYWGTYHPNSEGDRCWRDGSGHKRPHLTHWQPLPDPPKDTPDAD